MSGPLSTIMNDLDPHLIKCIGLMYESKKLRKGDPVPLQYILEEAIFQKSGITKDYTDIFQSFLPAREEETSISLVATNSFEDSKACSSDNELELDLLKEDLMCIVCNEMDVGARNRLLECSDCHSLYHQECHRPVVSAEDSFDDWTCSNCKTANKKPKIIEKDIKEYSKKSSSSHTSSSSSSKHSSHKSDKNKSKTSSSGKSSSSSSSSSIKPNINIVSSDKKGHSLKKSKSSSSDKRKYDY